MGPEVDQTGKRTSRYKRSSSFWPPQEDTREQTVKLLEDKSVGSLRIAKRSCFKVELVMADLQFIKLPKKEEKDTKNDEESLC